MRRSKSNPAKYARNYRKISQRRMTEQPNADGLTEEEELELLRSKLRNSTAHLAKHQHHNTNSYNNDESLEKKDQEKEMEGEEEEEDTTSSNRKKRKRKNQDVINESSCNLQNNDEKNEDEDNNNNNNNNEEYITDTTELILPSKRRSKQQKSKKQIITLTPEELKQAKAQHKALQRKLNQLETRHATKQKRQQLYQTLADHAISEKERTLMSKSADLGKKISRKEMLKKLLVKERAGVELTLEERGVLYTEVDVKDNDEFRDRNIGNEIGNGVVQEIPLNTVAVDGQEELTSIMNKRIIVPEENDDNEKVVPLAFPSSGQKKKKRRKKNKKNQVAQEEEEEESSKVEKDIQHTRNEKEDTAMDVPDEIDEVMVDKTETSSKSSDTSNTITADNMNKNETPMSSSSFAAQMMAGLSALKTKAESDKIELDKKEAEEKAALEEQRLKEEEEARKKRPVYKAPKPSILQSAAVMGLTPSEDNSKKNWRVMPISRPEDIEEKRYDLPVSAMEYEIVDSVRNNNVTVLCSETGSGKSTQVPQFLYESGMTLGNASSEGQDDGLLIGVTQPRRVAAISTAKRVCHEMGHSQDGGQSIRGKKKLGNPVAYQTKYESAGLGTKTRIKFMTDGILLQEIKSDLLLRKYAAIVLDEAHERNLNTDVLLGLLSVALPLREKAAKEGSLPPLKLIIMSATLRIEDFTANEKLFADCRPNLVKVPGRTFPVTVHHSKVTELDDYETAAYKKVCRIHRKLPSGGILVFLTGKQEIVRMVKRLRRTLIPKKNRQKPVVSGVDVQMKQDDGSNEAHEFEGGLRDMDDEEADGDIFQKNGVDDFDDEEDEEDDDINKSSETMTDNDEEEDNIPKNVIILPLYSLLSVKEQAEVFAPVEEGTRLIVVATNIAETSLTIPGVSYVVDTGRQKCRNYHASTGVASYNVMWISKAAADQRAGRAGRTGPGHCYRLFSSSVYARQLDGFALPEVLTRPLEDVVLSMKAMKIGNIANFPFPTAPDPTQLNAAIKLLANIGCVDISDVEREGGDGVITKLGKVISQLPLGVRYGKVLLITAQANVLDYGIAMVALLSESCPFVLPSDEGEGVEQGEGEKIDKFENLDQVDRTNASKQERIKRKENKMRWKHDGGDVLAGMLAACAYANAGRGTSNVKDARQTFCKENQLSPVIMQRIHKMRMHLARLAHQRLGKATGIAAQTGKILDTMKSPNRLQENLLKQAIASGLLDNVARRTNNGGYNGDTTSVPRSAYFSCRSDLTEPLFIDKNSVLYTRDHRQLPEWICYDTLVRKEKLDGSTISTMKNVTAIDINWLGAIAFGSKLLSLGEPLDIPVPKYDTQRDEIMCSVETKFGGHGWPLPSIPVGIHKALQHKSRQSASIMKDDSYRWFVRYLFEGKVWDDLKDLSSMLNDAPVIITRKKPVTKVALLISDLSSAEIDTAEALACHWATVDSKFLFRHLKKWTKKDDTSRVKKMWIDMVKKRIREWEAKAKS